MVLNRVREPSGAILEMTATVKTLLSDAELRQSAGILGISTFDHRWLLEPADGGTRFIQHEVDRGIGLWVVELGLDRARLCGHQRSVSREGAVSDGEAWQLSFRISSKDMLPPPVTCPCRLVQVEC